MSVAEQLFRLGVFDLDVEGMGIPTNRSTVVVHADINSVSRRSDPWPPATREARVKRVISRANAICGRRS
jgi:hypothetical protein